MGGKLVLELGLDSAVAGKVKGGGGKGGGDAGGNGNGNGELPENGIRVGDIVRVAEQPGGGARKREVREIEGKGVKGVVTRVGGRGVSVAVENGEEEKVDWGKRVWVVRLADEVTFKRYVDEMRRDESFLCLLWFLTSDMLGEERTRDGKGVLISLLDHRLTFISYRMNQTMTRLQRMKEEEYSSFIRVMFGLTTPSPVEEISEPQWIDQTLNSSQKDAIRFALGSREVALIHGPPGVRLFPISNIPIKIPRTSLKESHQNRLGKPTR